MMRPPPSSSLFPYTTLFRSRLADLAGTLEPPSQPVRVAQRQVGEAGGEGAESGGRVRRHTDSRISSHGNTGPTVLPGPGTQDIEGHNKAPISDRGLCCGWGRGRTGDLPLFRRTLVPTELPSRGVSRETPAVLTGFEPAASTLTGWRALQT